MCSKEVFINWDNHHDTLISIFEKLLQSNTLVDCTITAEGKIIKAHRIVLSACSSFFQMLFSQESEGNPIVVFTDMKFRELKSIIDYMYHGKVKIPADELDLFMETAATLEIRGLGVNLTGNEAGKRKNNESDLKPSEQSSNIPSLVKRRRKSSLNSNKENSVDSPKMDDSKNDRNNQKPSSSPEVVNQTQNQFQSSPPNISSHSSFFRPASSVDFLPTETENEKNKNNPSPYSPPRSSLKILPKETQIVEDIELQPITQIFLPEIVEIDSTDNGGSTEDGSDTNSKEKYPATEEDDSGTLRENQYTFDSEESRENIAEEVDETPVQLKAKLKESFQQLVMSQKQKVKKRQKQQPPLVQNSDVYPPIQIHNTYTCEEFNQLPNDGCQSEEGTLTRTLAINPASVQEINRMFPETHSQPSLPIGQNIGVPQRGINDSTVSSNIEMHRLHSISNAPSNSSDVPISPLSIGPNNCAAELSPPDTMQISSTSIGPCVTTIYCAPVGISSNFNLCENPSMYKITNLNGMTFGDVEISPQTVEGTNCGDVTLQSERMTTLTNVSPQSSQINEPWKFTQRSNRHGCFQCGQLFRSPYLLDIHMLKHDKLIVDATVIENDD